MCQYFISLARACCYERFNVKIQHERVPFLRLYPRFSGSASGFKEPQLLLICHSTRLPFFACAFVSTCRSIQPGTLLYGFWGGRQSATFHSILNSLYCTLAAHETHVNGWVGVNASKFATLRTVASFSAGRRAAEVLYYTQIFDRCIK